MGVVDTFGLCLLTDKVCNCVFRSWSWSIRLFSNLLTWMFWFWFWQNELYFSITIWCIVYFPFHCALFQAVSKKKKENDIHKYGCDSNCDPFQKKSLEPWSNKQLYLKKIQRLMIPTTWMKLIQDQFLAMDQPHFLVFFELPLWWF